MLSFKHAFGQNTHDGIVHDLVQPLFAEILLEEKFQPDKVRNSHEDIGECEKINILEFGIVPHERGSVAPRKVHIVLLEHFLVNGETSPDDVVAEGIFPCKADKALDALALPLITGLTILDTLPKRLLDTELEVLHEVAIDRDLIVEVDIEGPDSRSRLFADVENRGPVEPLFREYEFGSLQKLLKFFIAEFRLCGLYARYRLWFHALYYTPFPDFAKGFFCALKNYERNSQNPIDRIYNLC